MSSGWKRWDERVRHSKRSEPSRANICVTLTHEQLQFVQDMATAEATSVSAVVRSMIDACHRTGVRSGMGGR